jgi:hypothetical protein
VQRDIHDSLDWHGFCVIAFRVTKLLYLPIIGNRQRSVVF